jgi:electron transfer flavoprotein beta subunit
VAYNCVVCVKQVPDTKNITGDAMKEDGTVNRSALPAIFNPEDLHALEEALSVRDRFGGTVTVLTMGMPAAADLLRQSLYRGADRAVLITDRKAAGSDTLATSYILSCAVRKLKADLVFCGRQAIDGDTAQVGPQLADKLDMNLVTYLEDLISAEGETLTIRRNVGNGWEVVRVKTPVLLTVLDIANRPRPIAVKRMMKFKKAKAPAEVEKDAGDRAQSVKDALGAKDLLIEQWSMDDLDIDLDWCGLAGSPTKVNRIQSIVLTGGEYKQYEPTEEGVARLVGELIEDHTIG